MLGVTDAEQIRQTQILDRAREQLIAGASTEQQSRPGHLAELAAAARDMPHHWRGSRVRGGILIREDTASAFWRWLTSIEVMVDAAPNWAFCA
jgi:hypothetical protein